MANNVFSGVFARNWRKQLAAASERPKETIRTLKFPLELSDAPSWEQVRKLHGAVVSDEKGSLVHFIYATLLSGFRIFSKQSEMEAFRNEQYLQDAEWRENFLNRSDLSLASDFIPSKIYQRLLFSPRAVGGKDSGFKAATITMEYAKSFCGGKHSDKLPEAEARLFNALGVAFEAAFPDWKGITGNPVKAAAVIDDVLKRLGYQIIGKSLQSRIASIKPVEPKGTLAFDQKSPVFTDISGIEPHLICARAMHEAGRQGLLEKNSIVKFTQEYFTGDANHGGLAWLFGKGLVDYLLQTPVEEIKADFDIPNEREASLVAMLEAAKAIHDPGQLLLQSKNYSSYRSSIGGTLGSWISNYVNRLFDLQAVLTEEVTPIVFSDELLADEKLFVEIGTTPDEVQMLRSKAIEDRASALAALNRLMGDWQDSVASRNDVEVIERYSLILETLAGLLAALSERIKKEQSLAEAQKDDRAIKHLKTYEFTTPKWLKRLEKLNRLKLAMDDPGTVLKEAAEQFDSLREAMHRHFHQIQGWASAKDIEISPLKKEAAKYARMIANSAAKVKKSPEELAFRRCIDRLGRSARQCSDASLRMVTQFFKEKNIFLDESHANKYFFNRKGFLSQSPFDKNPQKPYPISLECVQKGEEILKAYGEMIAGFRKSIFSESKLDLGRLLDLFRLEQAYFGVVLVRMTIYLLNFRSIKLYG